MLTTCNMELRSLRPDELESVSGGCIILEDGTIIQDNQVSYRHADGSLTIVFMNDGHYTSDGELYVAPDGQVFSTFEACVNYYAQNYMDELNDFLAAFGPVGYIISEALDGQTPSRTAEDYGINQCT